MMKSYHFRILAVDDERPILHLYQEILCQSRKDSGSSSSVPSFDLTLCGQTQKAVEAVRVSIEEDRPFAVVFMDIRLPPGPDGIWAAEKIRELDGNVGIVLVTGYHDADLEELERRVPPPDKLFYLQKPFDPKEIWQFASFLCAKWISEIKLRAIQAHLESTVEERASALEAANKKLREEIENRIKAENRVRVSEENFRNIIASNADGIVILDEDQIVRFINPAAKSLFGRKADILIDQPFGYPITAGETAEFDIVSGDEGPVVAEMRLTRTKWEGKAALLASLRDITAHKRTKEDLQLSLNR